MSKRDLGLNHFAEPGPGGVTVIWHQHRDTGFPCGYGVMEDLTDPSATTGWLRCPKCGDVGRVEKGVWKDASTIPTVVRDTELVLAVPI